ncbi:MAG: hypothetical protein OHK0017_04050 [Patescibacteria group bacterium]
MLDLVEILIKRAATPKEPDKKTAKTDSPKIFRADFNFSIPIEAEIAVTIAVSNGGKPVIKPRTTPTRDTCDKVSASGEYLLTTRKIPINGAPIAIKVPAINAWNKKL